MTQRPNVVSLHAKLFVMEHLTRWRVSPSPMFEGQRLSVFYIQLDAQVVLVNIHMSFQHISASALTTHLFHCNATMLILVQVLNLFLTQQLMLDLFYFSLL